MVGSIEVWTSLLTSWATLILLFITAGNRVDEKLSEDDKQWLADGLNASLSPFGSENYNNINKRFQLVFDTVYGYRETPLEAAMLFLIMFVFFNFVFFRLIVAYSGIANIEPSTTLSMFLIYIISYSLLFSVMYKGIDWLTSLNPTEVMLFDISKWLWEYTKRNSFPVLMVLMLYFLISYGILHYFHVNEPITSRVLIAGLFVFSPIAAFLFSSLIRLYIRERVDLVNPFIAMFSSSIFILLGMILVPKARIAYLDTLKATGFTALSLISLNLFADTISLIETRWILTKSQTDSLKKISLLLVGDFFISGIIYMMLPITVGQNLGVFWNAIRFSGPQPWIGVFFWTTFSTSFIFYLFVMTIGLIQIRKPFMWPLQRIGRALEMKENPTFFIAIVMSLLITLGYVGVIFAIL